SFDPATGFQRAAAAPGVCPGYRCGHQGCRAHRLFLGLWRRSRCAGGPHEAAGRGVAVVAQTGGSALSTMSKDSVLACGSGIAGLAMALGLARAGFAAALLGPRTAPQPLGADVYHPRVYAISSSSQAFLDGLDVWSMTD